MKPVIVTYREPAKVEPYAEALRAAGMEPVLVAPGDPRDLAGAAGLLLTGGTDVNPVLYRQASDPRTQLPDNERDALEIRLMREALEQDFPVLAICRGMQLLNVVHGGSLVQHLDGHSVRTPDPAERIHDVTVAPGSRLGHALGAGLHPVNSRHHQAVGEVGRGLVPVAWAAKDGVIEGLERRDRRYVVAVQWHPEDLAPEAAPRKSLFESFAESLK